MHARSLKTAIRYFLQSYWTVSGCEMRVTPPPGKPIAMQGPMAITIHDGDQSFEGVNGFYARFGCVLTLSMKLDGCPVTQLEEWLEQAESGFNDIADALAAFLHKYRWQIREWADKLTVARPVGGIVTNIVVAPTVATRSRPQQRQADWWDGAVGAIKAAAGNRESMNIFGYSTDIPFGRALAMQTETPIER